MALADADREALLDLLAQWVGRDAKPFTRASMPLPDTTWFPDPFTNDAGGLARIAAQLLSYAGMDGYRVDVTVAKNASKSEDMLPRTSVDFACVEDGVVFLSCTALARADDALFAATQEIARAAMLERRARGGDAPYRGAASVPPIHPTDTEAERREASVYAVYVGLGVIATAGAHQYRQAGRTRGRMQVTEWAHVAYGALEPEEASFLLAVQLVTRGIDGARLASILAVLPQERREEVQAAMAALDRDTVIARLGLPPASAWEPEEEAGPNAPLAAEEGEPAEEEEEGEDDGAEEEEEEEREPVFRVPRRRIAIGVPVGAFGALVLGAVAHGVLFPTVDATLLLFVMTALGGGAGAFVAPQLAYDECSDCERVIPKTLAYCPGCHHPIGGTIADRSQRLTAREALQRGKRRRRKRARRKRE